MMINGLNLFDLGTANANYKGYYMDRDFNIYSTRTGSLKRLQGSMTASGRYFTLNGFTYRFDLIKNSAVTNSRFYTETQSTVAPATQAAAVAQLAGSDNDRQYASSVQAGIKGRGVVIGSVVNGRLVFGSDPKIHMTEKSWKAEIERLARNNPGVTFVHMKIGGGVVANGVTWL